jgi:hypothetical protein
MRSSYFKKASIGLTINELRVKKEQEEVLKQQSVDRHVAPLGHIILIPS